MAARVTVTTLVNTSPGRVFGFLKVANGHLQWSGGLRSISAEGTLVQGMTYQTTHVMLGREINSTNVVRQIVPDKLLEIHNVSGPLSYQVKYALIPSGSDTQVTCSISIASQHAAFNLAKSLFEMLIEAQIERDLGNLKSAAEQKQISGEAA